VSFSVAVRVDAAPKIGVGHVMRCLTLADALQSRGAQARFVSRHLPPELKAIVRQHGHECVVFDTPAEGPLDELAHADWLNNSQSADAADTQRAIGDRRWNWLIVDHYGLDVRWETQLRASPSRILSIDDLADRVHDCDVLLDQNVYADMATRYDGRTPAHCERLFGPGYALLREEFHQWRARITPRSGDVRRVMVCFGGVDAGNLTSEALEALRGLAANRPEVEVVVGASHPQLRATLATCEAAGYTSHVQSDNMAELMASADLALGAAGSTSWERCCVGLPSICVATAKNQVAVVRGLESRGVAIGIAAASPVRAADVSRALAPLLADPQRVASMSRAAWNLVDGRGAARVVDRMLETA